MSGTKVNKLRGAWADTKIEMLAWIQRTIGQMEPGSNAKDVESMVNATGKLIKMLGDIDPQNQDEGLEAKDLETASKQLSRAVKSFQVGTVDIFGSGTNEDEEGDSDE
jgi:hypothetical protein